MKNELDTLATQLGKEDNTPTRPFTLHLFANDNDKFMDSSPDQSKPTNTSSSPVKDEEGNVLVDETKTSNNASGNDYKNNLIENINSQFSDLSPKREVMDLMKMLDVL